MLDLAQSPSGTAYQPACPDAPKPGGSRTPRGVPRDSRRCTTALLSCLVITLAACGGGSGGGGDGDNGAGTPRQPASKAYAGKCAPDNTLAAANPIFRYTSGSLDDEKTWVRSYLDEAYLWYAEIPPADRALPAFNVTPAQVALDNWFEALKTPALTAGGVPKDRFSFTLPTAQWNALVQTGVVGGYGIEWVVSSVVVPRSARVAYVEPRSPAAAAGVERGDTLLAVGSGTAPVDFVNATGSAAIQMLNEALYAPREGTRTLFRLRGNGGAEREVTLTAGQVTTTPVRETRVLESGGAKVGYLLFNDFILPGEAQLKTAMQDFRAAAVSDLVLDLRYNGGGYLFIASQLAYMIAPTTVTEGKIFERSVFSDRRASATSDPANRMPFLGVSSGYPGSGTTADAPLPNLALNRVYVLTTAATCSASESIINGLRGVDVEVVVIGANTCGKPFGFTAKDNCGVSYFPVEFQGVNHKGFGDFADGFRPACSVADDLDNDLGSEREGLLAAALAIRSGASCESLTAPAVARKGAAAERTPPPGTVVRPNARRSKFLVP